MSMKVFSYVGMFLLLFRRSTCFDHTVVVPKAFRIDAPEKVILNLHGYHKATVSAYMQDLPFRRSLFSQIDRVVLSREEAASPVELTLMVKATDIETFRRKQTVDVVIEVTDTHGKDFTSHTEVLVSKQSGYVYVITDRPAYKPQEHVNIKVFPLSQAMKPDFSTIVSLSVKTPDGITVQKHYFALPQGDNFVEDLYEINQNPLFGKWSVEAKYAANGYKTTTETHFVIQRYVLPAFQVLIHPKKNFILATDKTITGEITATYSYGKPVSGNYFLTMKLKMSSRSDVSIPFYKKPKDFHAAVFRGGKRTFEVQTSDIKKVLAKGDDLSTLVENQASIFIEATVNDFNTGIMESAISPNIPFVSSPYIIDTKTTSPYFTPTLSYQLRVNVHFAIGGKLAPLVDVKIQVQGVAKEHKTTSNAHGEVKALLDFSSAKSQVIIIKTADVTLSNKIAQAEKRLTIRPYQSSSKSYLQIKLRDDEVKKVNQNIQITFSVNAPNPDQIRYYVLARGTIVHTGMSVARSRDKVKEITESISITQEMVPSARIVAYYIRGKELVSDSIWFDVEDRCKTELALEVPEEVLPGSDISIGVTGSSGALVSIAGVDKAAYFLYNESRLTRDRMFDEMESYDQGCTRSGGENTKSVFMDAGLYISSRNLKQLPVRTLNCSMSRRRRKKREVISEERLNQMKLDASLDKCKLDGKQFGIITNDTCLMRWKRCEDDEEDLVRGCCKEFLSACYKEEKEREKAEARAAGRSLFGGAGGVEANLGRVRENFHESLMFTNIKLNGNGKGDYQTSAKDQITTFDIDAVSMQDSNDGFCVANTAEMRVFKHVFLKLITPYSLRKLEQTNLRISVFNYHKTNSYTVNCLEDEVLIQTYCT